MHRSHDAAQTKRSVQALRDAGIENISLDLIFGLPEELQRNWERDLDILCSLRPVHCSLYGLTVEPRTPLDRWISRGATHAPDEERYAEEYLMAHRRLAAEVEFYEVSNAAREGYRPPQLGVLVGQVIRRARPRGALVRWQNASLESQSMGSVSAGYCRRSLARGIARNAD